MGILSVAMYVVIGAMMWNAVKGDFNFNNKTEFYGASIVCFFLWPLVAIVLMVNIIYDNFWHD